MFSDNNNNQELKRAEPRKHLPGYKKPITTPSRFVNEQAYFPQILSENKFKKHSFVQYNPQLSQSFTDKARNSYQRINQNVQVHQEIDQPLNYWMQSKSISQQTNLNDESLNQTNNQINSQRASLVPGGGKRKQQPVVCTADFAIDLKKVFYS